MYYGGAFKVYIKVMSWVFYYGLFYFGIIFKKALNFLQDNDGRNVYILKGL